MPLDFQLLDESIGLSPDFLGLCSVMIPAGFDTEKFQLPVMYKGKQKGTFLVTVKWQQRYHIGGPSFLTHHDTKEWCSQSKKDTAGLVFKPSGWELVFEVDRKGVVSGQNHNVGDEHLKHNRGRFVNAQIKMKVLITNGQRNVYVGSVNGDQASVTITIETVAPGTPELPGDWRCARGTVIKDFQHPSEKASKERKKTQFDYVSKEKKIRAQIRSENIRVKQNRDWSESASCLKVSCEER